MATNQASQDLRASIVSNLMQSGFRPANDLGKELGVNPTTIGTWVHTGLVEGLRVGRVLYVKEESAKKHMVGFDERKRYAEALKRRDREAIMAYQAKQRAAKAPAPVTPAGAMASLSREDIAAIVSHAVEVTIRRLLG